MSADLLSSTRSSPSRSQSIAATYNANDEKSFSSISSIYGKNSGLEVKTCAALQEMVNVRIPSQSDQWWCIVVRMQCFKGPIISPNRCISRKNSQLFTSIQKNAVDLEFLLFENIFYPFVSFEL